MSFSMYFPEILGSSEWGLLFSEDLFFWVEFGATDAGLWLKSESFDSLPQIGKKN